MRLPRGFRWLMGIVGILLASLIYLYLKASYLGWEYQKHGSVGEYQVVAYKTV